MATAATRIGRDGQTVYLDFTSQKRGPGVFTRLACTSARLFSALRRTAPPPESEQSDQSPSR
jgi:hypothetical protein